MPRPIPARSTESGLVSDLLLRETLDRELDQRTQPGAASLEVSDDRVAHARLPEAAQVVLDGGDGGVAVRLGAEERLDVVGHLDEILRAHAASLSARAAMREPCAYT